MSAPARPLSPRHARLQALLAADAGLRRTRIDLASPDVGEFLRHYGPTVNPWPLLVDAGAARDFAPIVASLPRILYRALHARFGDDGQAFADYFGWPRLVYDVLRKAPVDTREIISRYDVVSTARGYRILELNCSSAIGGWQTDWLQPAVQANLARQAESAGWPRGYRRIFRSMLGTTLAAIGRRKRGAAPGDIAMYAFVRAEQHEALRRSLQSVYDEWQPGGAGRIRLFTDLAELSFSADNMVSLRGEPVDAVLLTLPDAVAIPEETLRRLNVAALAGRLYFPDSPFHTVLDSKLNFALLHECCALGLLDADDAAIVTRYVPWTAVVRDQPASAGGETASLPELLARSKDALVLKKADSFGGRHVYIGHRTAMDEWKAALAAAVREGGWIAQEFCPPERVDACDPDLQAVVPHEFIWGVFGMGGEYAGAFVRGLPVREGDGVINAANGAVIFVVMESDQA